MDAKTAAALKSVFSDSVPLKDVRVNVSAILGDKAPKSLSIIHEEGIRSSFEDFYFHTTGEKSPTLSRSSVVKITNIALSLGVDARTIVATLVVAYQSTSKANAFNAYMATANDSVIKDYAQACRSSFGFYDVRYLDVMFNTTLHSITDATRFLNSEKRLCKLIVNTRVVGMNIPVQDLIEAREDNFDPVWLAIQPFYTRYVLEPYIRNGGDVTAKLKEIRSTVTSIRSVLIKQKSRVKASYYFNLRTESVQPALAAALKKYSATTSDFFLKESSKFEYPELLYAQLGKAVSYLECTKYLREGSSVF